MKAAHVKYVFETLDVPFAESMLWVYELFDLHSLEVRKYGGAWAIAPINVVSMLCSYMSYEMAVQTLNMLHETEILFT